MTTPLTGIFSDLSADSGDAQRFKLAARDLFGYVGTLPPPPPVRLPLDMARVQSRLYEVIEPRMAIARRFASSVTLPGLRVTPPNRLPEAIVPVMAYPDFKEAMYRPLRELGNDNICPGIGRIPPNKITLLLTNSPFVESYMVGLNHEMGRELLWREYPTDQRGSYFRTFWEKNGFAVPNTTQTAEQQAEAEKDIPRLHTWGKRTQLGAHPNPPPASGIKPPDKVVLTIRSDLFKRYPNTVVFAQRAKWLNQAEKTREMDETLEVNPGTAYDTEIIKTPLFGADFPPDVKCFGFNLTLAQARGTDTDPGWYFVVMERPGEPRFGMDEPDPAFNFADPPQMRLWNDLTWGHLTPSRAAYEQLTVLRLDPAHTPQLNGPMPTDPDDKLQRTEDNAHSWGTQSASLAYILYQAPVKWPFTQQRCWRVLALPADFLAHYVGFAPRPKGSLLAHAVLTTRSYTCASRLPLGRGAKPQTYPPLMEAFDKDRADLRKIRDEKNQLAARLAQLQRDKQQLDKTIEQAGRLGNQEKLHQLLQERDRLKGQVSEAERGYVNTKSAALVGLNSLLERYKAPQQYINFWDDHLPILLFPVRVETRFAPNRQPDNAELWVRIYPDEATVVQHDPDLTDAELTAANTFWFETWKANTEAEKLGAWTALVGGVGSRRAAWIAHSTEPANFGQTDAAIIQFPTDAALLALGLTPAEQKAGKNYWRSSWFGNPADAVQTTLETAVGSGRAAAVQSATQPANWAALQEKTPADEFARVVVLSQPNVPPGHEGQTASYAEVLPDQFVVIGYHDQRKVFELTGNAIPDRIWLSPNVSPLDGGITRDADGQLQFDGDLAWMKDFDAAVNTGLGLRIDLRRAINRTVVTEQNGSQAAADAILRDVATLGLTRLLVVGINAVDGADNGRVLLEKLFDNHHFGQTGLSFVPQGTPTNNTEGNNAGHRAEPAADESYALERKDPLFTDQTNVPFYQKSNGQRMADYLGINSTVFQHLAHSADAELAEAQAMNVALYNATLAYYFDEMMDPLVSRADQHRIFQFFTQYVSARGSLPALRVGRQPYGILPTTAIDRWKWTNEEVREGRQFAVPFHDKLVSLIQVFDRNWADLAKYPFRAGQGGQALAGKEQFLHMLGLEPTSVTYSQRWLYGRQFVRSFVYVLLGRDVSADEMERWKKGPRPCLSNWELRPNPRCLARRLPTRRCH